MQLDPIYDGTEVGANRPLTNQLFESDMVLTVEQMKGYFIILLGSIIWCSIIYFRVVLAATQRNRRVKRKVIVGGVYRWPQGKPIPYRFKGGNCALNSVSCELSGKVISAEWKQLIRAGLAIWQKETCLRFQENWQSRDHIVFIRGSG